MSQKRKNAFSWNLLGGDMDMARPGLGPELRIEVYRLFQFTLRDVLEQRFGTETTDDLFREAGTMAGRAFYGHFCKDVQELPELIKIVQERFKELGIGIFRVETADENALTFTMTVDEDLDCSGLPDNQEEVCVYDEGFIQGLLESFCGKPFVVREVDCWCTGGRTCRFNAKPAK